MTTVVQSETSPVHITTTRGPRCARVWVAGFSVLALVSFVPCAAWSETATVELLNGDKMTGTVLERTDHVIVLQHAVLGRLEIPIEKVAPASLHPGLLGTSILAGWKKELDFGVAGSSGDTDEADIRLALSLDRRSERHHWQLDGLYEVSYSEGEIDEHDASVTALHDWLWPGSRWFAFTFGVYDFDEFEAWEHRTTLGAGPAYHLLQNPSLNLDARFGPFITYEFGDENDARPEGALGLFAEWQIREGHSLTASNVYLQTLDEAELRSVSKLEWKVRLAVSKGVSLKVGARNEYDTASRDSKNNLKYYTALSFDL